MDREIILPRAASQSFWLDGSAWQFPDYDNTDTFVDRLVRHGVLVRDADVAAVLQDQLQEVPSRTMQHRFRRATGLTQSHIRQAERAKQAAALLRASRFDPRYRGHGWLSRSASPDQIAQALDWIYTGPNRQYAEACVYAQA